MLRIFCCLSLVLFTTALRGGEFNEKLNYLDSAPTWSDLPGVDGKTHSLVDLKEKEVVVVAFMCNSCPYAIDYEQRLISLTQQHAVPNGKVAVVAINVNLVAEDNIEAMTKRSQEQKFPYRYLFDASQKIARDFGASRTPEFFVLNKQRQVIYMGAFDDNTNPDKVSKHYVVEAIQAALNGERPAVVETIPVGCAVRYQSDRRRKPRQLSP